MMTDIYGHRSMPPAPAQPAPCVLVPGTVSGRKDLSGHAAVLGATTAGRRQAPLALTAAWRQSVQLPFVQRDGALIRQRINGLSANVVGTAKPSVVAGVEASGVPPRGRPV
jgi:hypothetical protein